MYHAAFPCATHSVSSRQVNAEPSSPRTQQKDEDIRPAQASGGEERKRRGTEKKFKRYHLQRYSKKISICNIMAQN